MLWTIPLLNMLVILAFGQEIVTVAPSELKNQEPMSETSSLEKPKVTPTIRLMHITSDIKYRYATTLVSTRVVNPANYSGEALFTVTLPESAFISKFLMVVKDKVYKAYVKEKGEAKETYDQAVQAGQFAGHVALNARDSNQFTVSVNIEGNGKVTFNLTYEQLLSRTNGVYGNIININPQQIVEDLSVKVDIEEPTAIVDLEIPEFQLSNEAVPDKSNKLARIEEISDNHKRVIWTPTPDQQKNQNSTDGLSGQFIVKYDIYREENPQQIIVDEGYFVHFFAPDNLPKLKKHAVFVLDYSGSMIGRKLDQLKDAMKQILSDLTPTDYFSIVIFHSLVEAWSPSRTIKPDERDGVILDSQFVVEATTANIERATSFLHTYDNSGNTNIMGGLRAGLKLVNIGTEQWVNESDPPQPVIVFLTDGQPNVEESDTVVITRKTTELNTKRCPIFSLAFGYGADLDFLRKLSLQNNGFARNIYEAADASLQLKNFYETVASPLLSNVTFSYLPGQIDNSTNTKVEFPMYFSGSELVVAGKINKDDVDEGKPIGELRGITAHGPKVYPIIIDNKFKMQNRKTGHLEKSWAYLTIQQLLDKAESLDKDDEKNQTKKKAIDLALQYSFVTPLTSLVVVKPNDTEPAVDATKVRPARIRPSMARKRPHMRKTLSSGYGIQTQGAWAHYEMPRPHRISDPYTIPPMPLGPGSAPLTTRAPIMNRYPHKIPLEDVMWLQASLTNASSSNNATVTIDGAEYKLGINETNVGYGDCHLSNEQGECRHVQYCALDVFQYDSSLYLPYRCSIPGEYLGVCCPKRLI